MNHVDRYKLPYMYSFCAEWHKKLKLKSYFLFFTLISAYDWVVTSFTSVTLYHHIAKGYKLRITNARYNMDDILTKNRNEWFIITLVRTLFHSISSKFIIIRSASSSFLEAHTYTPTQKIELLTR
jgi:hypothetical protein